MWKQFRKAYPKKTKPIPTRVKNCNGKVRTSPEVTLEHFEHRLRKRPNHEDIEEIPKIQENTLKMIIVEEKHNKNPPFSIIEVNRVTLEIF